MVLNKDVAISKAIAVNNKTAKRKGKYENKRSLEICLKRCLLPFGTAVQLISFKLLHEATKPQKQQVVSQRTSKSFVQNMLLGVFLLSGGNLQVFLLSICISSKLFLLVIALSYSS